MAKIANCKMYFLKKSPLHHCHDLILLPLFLLLLISSSISCQDIQDASESTTELQHPRNIYNQPRLPLKSDPIDDTTDDLGSSGPSILDDHTQRVYPWVSH